MLKKMLVLSAIVAVCFSCGDSGQTKADKKAVDSVNAANKPAPTDDNLTKNPDYAKGLALIGNADCFTCHKIDETSAGPAYRDVANKYTNDDATVNMLADKVIKGGSGVWGSGMMIPHAQLSKDDAKQMVKYILLLKNK